MPTLLGISFRVFCVFRGSPYAPDLPRTAGQPSLPPTNQGSAIFGWRSLFTSALGQARKTEFAISFT